MRADGLFRQFILRHLLRERARTLTTILGIALGVGVVVAIQLTNASSVRGFETALETVAGNSGVEIVGNGGIDETRLPSLLWLREVGAMSPVIEGEMALVMDHEGRRPRRSEALRVLGVDILRDVSVRDYVVGAAGNSGTLELRNSGTPEPRNRELTQQQFLDLLTSPRSIVITEKLARRRDLGLGSEIRLMAGDRVHTFVVRGLLADRGPARVMDGSFALMDIAAAQLAFDRLGRIDRIDVTLGDTPDSAAIDRVLQELNRRLPAGLTAQRPARRGQQVERMLAAFHLNLTALSWVALVVGLFLVYNTVTISVIARREEIGTLRALGVTSGRVLRLFLGEAAALGALGTLLGILVGRTLADSALGLTSSTVTALYIASAAAPPDLTWQLVAFAFAMGVPLSLAAAWLPAREASRVPPTDAIRGHDRIASPGAHRGRWAGAIVLLAGAVVMAQLAPVDGRPLFGYAASFATILGTALLVPALIHGLSRILRVPLRRAFGVEGLLAHANLAAAVPRLSISIAALAVSLSMMVAIAIMIGSFRDTVVYWVGQTLQADLFVGPAMQPTVGSEQTLSAAVIDAVTRHPEVEATDAVRRIDLVFEDRLVVLAAANLDVALARGSLLFKEPADGARRLRELRQDDSVLVSETLANRHGKRPGDTVVIETRSGPRPFLVAGVYYDYAADRGVIAMNWPAFTRHFGDLPPTGIAAYVTPAADPERVRQEILDRLDEGHRAFIYTNRALRREVLRIFDSTFAITYALELIAITVAMLGVAATLLTLVLERRRELSMLRLIGAARRQVQRMVVIEAAMIGAASQVIGLMVGFALSVLLVYVINVQSFGWTIQFRVPYAFLAQVSVLVVMATALAGLYPARRAADLLLVREE
jgi:putative ABC transport system permease protein